MPSTKAACLSEDSGPYGKLIKAVGLHYSPPKGLKGHAVGAHNKSVKHVHARRANEQTETSPPSFFNGLILAFELPEFLKFFFSRPSPSGSQFFFSFQK
jgi:hypothetical protein